MPGTIDVFNIDNFKGDLVQGKISAEAGEAAFGSVVKVIELAIGNQIAATVTAPI